LHKHIKKGHAIMEKVIYSLIGVAFGYFLSFFKEWWFKRRDNRKNLEYLSTRITCMLDKFVSGCADVVSDDGSHDGQQLGEPPYPQVEAPIFDPEAVNVEWRSLPASLMYEILNISNEIEYAEMYIRSTFENVDYDEGIDERRIQYARLGTKASKLATKLRDLGNLPQADYGDWDPVEFIGEQLDTLESRRRERQEKQREFIQKFRDEASNRT
jgi:hypothetical protein